MKNTKRWTVVVAAVCLSGMISNADSAIKVNLITRDASHLAAVFHDELGNRLAVDSVAVLYWTSSASFIDPGSSPLSSPHAIFNNADPTVPTGGDLLLAVFPTTGSAFGGAGHILNPSFSSAWFSSEKYGVDLPSGYVYLAVFNLSRIDYMEKGIPAGTFYSLVPAQPFNVVDKSGPIDMPDKVGIAVAKDGPYTMTHQTIPEPGTIALLGLAGLALLIRRRLIRG